MQLISEEEQLDRDIKIFLNWTTDCDYQQPDPDLAWINDIAKLGDRTSSSL